MPMVHLFLESCAGHVNRIVHRPIRRQSLQRLAQERLQRLQEVSRQLQL